MATLTMDGLEIAYDDAGAPELRCVMLVHGFSSNRHEGWKRTGWYAALDQRRERRIAFDLRGHGESARPHDPALYGHRTLSDDIVRLMDAAGVQRASLIGYSLGARLALGAAIDHPDRFDHLVLGGIGARLLDPPRGGDQMVAAMTAASADEIADPLLRSFRQFADEQGEDRLALAACSQGEGRAFSLEDLARVRTPTLVVAGARDHLAGSVEGLADAIPGAFAETLPGCDHFSAIAHAFFKGKVFDFLDGWLDAPEPPGFR